MTQPSGPPTDAAPETPPAEQGSQAREVGQVPGRTPGEEMARKLVRDVAAYEVDPPPPARVDAHPQDAPPSAPRE